MDAPGSRARHRHLRMMTNPESAFIDLGNGAYRATALTRGPWNPKHQHAGPPIALVAGAIERAAAQLELRHIARLTANLLRPIPIDQVSVAVQTEYAGRNVAHFAAQRHQLGSRFQALCLRKFGPYDQSVAPAAGRMDLRRRADARRPVRQRPRRGANLRCPRPRGPVDAVPADPDARLNEHRRRVVE